MNTYSVLKNGEWITVAKPENGEKFREFSPDGILLRESYWYEQDKAVAERAWKNAELARTQDIMAVPDYRYHTEMAAYRQALMDWTDTDDFPDVRPVIPLTPKGYPIL